MYFIYFKITKWNCIKTFVCYSLGLITFCMTFNMNFSMHAGISVVTLLFKQNQLYLHWCSTNRWNDTWILVKNDLGRYSTQDQRDMQNLYIAPFKCSIEHWRFVANIVHGWIYIDICINMSMRMENLHYICADICLWLHMLQL